MDIWSQKGTKVVYIGGTQDQFRYGGGDDPTNDLVVGAVYTVEHTEIHSWNTNVVLEEVPNKKFNSVMFL